MSEVLCLECGELVEPRVEKEFVGEVGHGGYQYDDICPRCGAENNFSEYTYCEICDKPIPNHQDRCDECIDRLLDKVLEKVIEEEKREQESR